MFFTFFKSSVKALPVLVLVPILMFTLFALVVDGFMSDQGLILAEPEWYSDGLTWIGTVMAISVLVNFILLMIIPAAIGGLNARSKQVQFYLGFFINLALMLLIPVIAHMIYMFNGLTLGILIALCSLGFLVTFIVGSRFVAPAYVRAFWFSH